MLYELEGVDGLTEFDGEDGLDGVDGVDGGRRVDGKRKKRMTTFPSPATVSKSMQPCKLISCATTGPSDDSDVNGLPVSS